LNGGNKSVLKLNTQAYITGQLTLTAGLFDISTFDINMDGRTINGGSTASYVQTTSTGRLQRDVASSARLFPVGRSSYNPATLTNAGTSDKYSIRVVDKLTNVGTNADSDNQSDSAVVKRTWMIDENVVGGSNVTLRLDWNELNEHQTRFDPVQPYIAHYNSTLSKWENKGWSLRTFTSGQGFVQTTGITDFSPFGISSPEGGVALPVELIYFNSSCEENNLVLNWATASEYNNLQFIILTSEDGLNWKENGTVAGAGNSTEKIDYHYVISEKRGIQYIKLIQVDIDWKSTEYGPYLSSCHDQGIEFEVFPNPANESINIQVENNDTKTIAKIRLIDMNGSEILQENVDFLRGVNNYRLELSKDLKGLFFVEFIENKTIHRKKIIVI